MPDDAAPAVPAMSRRDLGRVAVGWVWTIVVGAGSLGGCVVRRIDNPSLPVSPEEARGDLERMADEPVEPRRPVVVLSGWGDIGLVSSTMRRRLRRVLGGDVPVVAMCFPLTLSMDAARRKVVRTVRRRLGSSGEDGLDTVEVDVIAFSMGGLVARYAAASLEGEGGGGGGRLRVRRMFTISSPHGGALMADLPIPDPKVLAMRSGSRFLEALDGHEADYELYAYTRLDDPVVGSHNTGVEGHPHWWVDVLPATTPHKGCTDDPRVLADIFRRLRGEEPLATEPAAPLPAKRDGRRYTSATRPDPAPRRGWR